MYTRTYGYVARLRDFLFELPWTKQPRNDVFFFPPPIHLEWVENWPRKKKSSPARRLWGASRNTEAQMNLLMGVGVCVSSAQQPLLGDHFEVFPRQEKKKKEEEVEERTWTKREHVLRDSLENSRVRHDSVAAAWILLDRVHQPSQIVMNCTKCTLIWETICITPTYRVGQQLRFISFYKTYTREKQG